MVNKLLLLLALVAFFGLGIWVAGLWYKPAEEITEIDSTVLLEKVQNVCKLVTVEGTFSELYDETNIRQLTFYLPVATSWKFSKSAIIHVKGKVLVGYDLEAIELIADESAKTIYLKNLPEPEILSIDHEVEYKNLEESFFNSFTAKDFTQLNDNAKKVLREKAAESRLMEQAGTEGIQMLDAIEYIVESAGWTLAYEGQTSAPTRIEEEEYMN